jgi:hypothetical protein
VHISLKYKESPLETAGQAKTCQLKEKFGGNKMQKTASKTITTLIIAILTLSMVLSAINFPIASAASGTITMNPVAFTVLGTPGDVEETVAVLNGGVFGSGATVELWISSDTTFTHGSPDVKIGEVTLPAGQTSFSNTVVTLFTGTQTLSPGTYYIAATDPPYTTWTAPVTVTLTSRNPTLTLDPWSRYPTATVVASGSNYLPGTVNLYLGYPGGTLLATATADETGYFSVSFTVPYLAQGDYTVVAQDTSTLSEEATLTITPRIIEPFDIAGNTGESFTIRAVGLKAGKTILASTTTSPQNNILVGGVMTYHPAATTGTDGTLTITVTLSASISVTGTDADFVDVDITYTVGDDPNVLGILVSKPEDLTAPRGLEAVKLPSSASVGSSVTVTVWNFPAGASVSVYIGSTLLTTIPTDSLGAGRKTATLPPMPGLFDSSVISYTVTAVDDRGFRDATPPPFTVERTFSVIDRVTGVSVVGTYVENGRALRIIGSGLAPSKTYTVTQVDSYIVTTDANGSFTLDISVKLPVSVSTGTPMPVTIAPSTNIYVNPPTFSAIGTPTFYNTKGSGELTYYSSAPSVTVTFTAGTLGNLVPGRAYSLYMDGALLTLGLTGFPDYFEATLTGQNPELTFAAPATPGVHVLSIRYRGAATDLAAKDFIVSSPTAADVATVTASITSGGKLIFKLYNFPASQPLTFKLAGATLSVDTGYPSATDTAGALETRTATITKPAGTYAVWIEYTIGGVTYKVVPIPSSITIVTSALTLSSSSGVIGTSVTCTIYGLKPNTAYAITWAGILIPGSTTLSTSAGSIEGGLPFIVPTALPGTYTVAVVETAAPTVPIKTATFTVTEPSGLVVTPDPSAFPGQLVTFVWSDVGTGLIEPVYVTVLLNDQAYTTFPARYDPTAPGTLYGSFQMPNAPAGTTWKLSFKYFDSRQTSSWQTVDSGSTTFSFSATVNEEAYNAAGSFAISQPQNIATFAGIILRLTSPVTGSEKLTSGTTSFTLRVTVTEATDEVVIDNPTAGYIAVIGSLYLVITAPQSVTYTTTPAPFTLPVSVRTNPADPATQVATVSISGSVTAVDEAANTISLTLSAFSFATANLNVGVEGVSISGASYTEGLPSDVSDPSVSYWASPRPYTVTGLTFSGDVLDTATNVVIGSFSATGSVTIDEGTVPNEGASGAGTIRVVLSSFSFNLLSGSAVVVTVGATDTGADPYTGGSGTATGPATYSIKTYALANDPQEGSSGPVALKLVEGSGALIMSISDADVTRIANAVNATVYGPIATVVTQTGDAVKVALTDLINGKISDVLTAITNVNGTLYAQIETKYGDMVVKIDTLNTTLLGVAKNLDGYYLLLNTTLGDIKVKLDAVPGLITDAKAEIVNDVDGKYLLLNTTLGDIKVKLDAINAKLVDINGTVATIDSNVGAIKADVAIIKPKIVSVEGDVATIKSDVGSIKVDVSAIKPVVTDIKDGVATIRTTVGDISGKVITIDGNVAKVMTDVGIIKADASTIKTSVEGVPTLTIAIWIAVVLSLIAAIAAIYSVVTIHRKIAG